MSIAIARAGEWRKCKRTGAFQCIRHNELYLIYGSRLINR
jgi:hypothetical protein